MPYIDGGDESDENLILLCPNHHALAHALSAIWRLPSKRGKPKEYLVEVTKPRLIQVLNLMQQYPDDWADRYDARLNKALDPEEKRELRSSQRGLFSGG